MKALMHVQHTPTHQQTHTQTTTHSVHYYLYNRLWVTDKSLILPVREKKSIKEGQWGVGGQVVFVLTEHTTLCASRPFYFNMR